MKKIVAMLMMAAMTLTLLTGCGSAPAQTTAADTQAPETADTQTETTQADTQAETTQAADSDLAYIQNKGTLVVGMTDFAPMDYKEAGSDEWVGFDADMARAFAASLGVDVEFVEITWSRKDTELKAMTIDCVWNGMTLTDGVLSTMSCSKPYCLNGQVVVLPKDKAEQYQTEESIKELFFAVEAGSAGEKVLTEMGLDFLPVDKQSKALMEVAAGTADACVIDLLMAGAMIGEGTDYTNLTYTVQLNSEEYGVGFRQESDLTELLNAFFAQAYADGSMMERAKKYGVQESIIPQE